MAGDDVNERDAIRQVLEEECPAAIRILKDDDISKLAAAGYFTTDALAEATMERLNAVLPGRPGVVGLLLMAFVQPAGKPPLNKSKSSLKAAEALRQVLEEKYPDSGVEVGDIIKLLAAGFSTPAALAAATMERLDAVLPGRPGVVGLLLKAFVQPADVKIGDTLSAEHGLSKFVACLRNQEPQEIIKNAKAGSLIKLPEGVLWLGDESTFTNELFVRPCYLELLEAKEKYFELSKALNAVVYTGTPGIGKSHLCAFVIAQKLIEGKTVYFEKAIAHEFFKLELEGGVRWLENMRVLQLVQEKATAVYIVDGGSPSILQSPVESQIFASLSESLFRPEKKVWPTWLFLYTPLFDLEEMCKCRSAVSAFSNAVSQAAVEAWFLVAGGVARTVLKAASAGTSLESWKAGVLFTAQSLDEKALQQMSAGLRGSTFAPGSYSLFHWDVEVKYVEKSSSTSPDKQELRRFKRKMLHFASDWVANIIYLNLRLDSVLKAMSSIMSTTGEVETSALRGYWFGTVSNMILSGGGTFQCRWLDTGDEFKLTLPVSQLCTYKSHEDASVACKNDLSVYCVPLARNEVAIDAMSSPYLFFQMASGAKHTINKALSKLLNTLKEKGRSTPEALEFVTRACVPPRMELEDPVFVFCTTPTHFKNDLKTNQNFVSKRKVVEHGRILQQAVLEVPIDFVESRLGGQIDLKAVLDSRSTLAQID